MNFNEWMNKVDALLVRRHGLASNDLPDWMWKDAFEDEYSPEDAVVTFLEEFEDNYF